MRTVCEINECNGCMACNDACPKGCISIKDNMNHFNAVIDEKKCINCGYCERICPNLSKVEKLKPILWKQGWAEPDIRKSSSSGGAATSLISMFIKSGGYVASCMFDDGEFVFDITNNMEVAKHFSGSKYVKTNPKGIFKKIRQQLETNDVLFIGLPCQVAALKNFVNDHERLYTVDLICHGTPSSKLLDIFLTDNNINIKNVKDIKFRDNNNMGLIIDGNKLTSRREIDNYLCAFLEATDYTLNCYHCHFASLNRVSDITLGDSWGSNLKREMNDGISLILVQTHKGELLLNKSNMFLKDVNLDVAIKNNHQLTEPSKISYRRNVFFNAIKQGESFQKATFLALPKLVIKQKIKRILTLLHILS